MESGVEARERTAGPSPGLGEFFTSFKNAKEVLGCRGDLQKGKRRGESCSQVCFMSLADPVFQDTVTST